MAKRLRMVFQHDGAPAHYCRLVTSSTSNIPRTMDRPRWSRSVATKVPRTYSFRFCLWGWMKSEVYKEKVNTRDELVARVMNSAVLLEQERLDDHRRATRTVAKRVEKCTEVDGGKSALKSMVGFLNTYFELLQFIEIIYITNKCNQYVIYPSFISFVRLFMRNIQTAVSHTH